MRLPRLRLRTLMVLIAVVAVGLWVEMLRRRSVEYRRRATNHGRLKADCTIMIGSIEGPESRLMTLMTSIPGDEPLLARPHSKHGWTVLAEYEAKIERKYLHAARYPWLPVEPDPPEPE